MAILRRPAQICHWPIRPHHGMIGAVMAASPAATRRSPRTRRRRVGGAWQKLKAVPRSLRIVGVVVLLVAVFSVVNLVYQVLRKPTEMFFPVSGSLNKGPADTWRNYASLFRANSTANISPELLAALAQVESAGNPVARTYWRWSLTWASVRDLSARVERRRPVPDDQSGLRRGAALLHPPSRRHRRQCRRRFGRAAGSTALYTRVVPSHAIELTAVYLDRAVAAILADRAEPKASPRQRQDLAAIVHLCGAGPARRFARHGFHLSSGERCGDHDVATYVATVDTMERQFLRLAADS
jgi:hypothetical protein